MPSALAYFDTSVLIKRYISEPGSDQVLALLRRHACLSSALVPAEVISTLCIRRRDGELSESKFMALLKRIEDDRTRWELVEAGPLVLRRAEEIMQGGIPVNLMEAIHLASFLTFQVASGLKIPFVTGDIPQRELALQFGAEILWVG
jgi:predicted nucleic acid-binding protein